VSRPQNTIVGRVNNGFLGRMMKFSPPAIVLWLAVANRADQVGQCNPSINTLMEDTGLSKATIYRATAQLVEGGEMTVTPGGGLGNPSNTYHLTGSIGNELVQEMNQSNSETKVFQSSDKGSLRIEHKPNILTKHKNQTKLALGFDVFWGVIPSHKKSAKRDAEKAYEAALRRLNGKHADPVAFLLDRARAYYASPLGQTRYCNGPAPFLNQGHYEDDPAAWERNDNGQPQAETKPPAPIRLLPTRTK